NQSFWRNAGGCFDRADELRHARLQTVRIAGIEQAGRRRWSDACALRIRFHSCLAAACLPDIEYNSARNLAWLDHGSIDHRGRARPLLAPAGGWPHPVRRLPALLQIA